MQMILFLMMNMGRTLYTVTMDFYRILLFHFEKVITLSASTNLFDDIKVIYLP